MTGGTPTNPITEAEQQAESQLEENHAEGVTVAVESDAEAEAAKKAEEAIALIRGVAVEELPQDLYIPPDALEVILEAFEGPLDLLLYLIKRQNLDILDIPVAEITQQYVAYIELMDQLKFELAAEYLVMAATLAEIKSRMLLPRANEGVDEEDDPRAELIRRLQEYERFKAAAENVDSLPRLNRDTFVAEAEMLREDRPKPRPDIDLRELLFALHDVMKRADMYSKHEVQAETLTVRERMGIVLEKLSDRYMLFIDLFNPEEGKGGAVVTFLAVLELLKTGLLDLAQTDTYSPIHVRLASGAEEDYESVDFSGVTTD